MQIGPIRLPLANPTVAAVNEQLALLLLLELRDYGKRAGITIVS